MNFSEERVNIDTFTAKMDLDKSKYAVGKNCKLSYNTQVKHGVLSAGKGLKILTLPMLTTDEREYQMYEQDFSFIKLWHYTYYSIPNDCQEYLLVAYGSDGKLYFSAEFAHVGNFYHNYFNSAFAALFALRNCNRINGVFKSENSGKG